MTGELDPDFVVRVNFPTVTVKIAKALIEYGKNEVYSNPVEIARCRIATALVLHNESTDETREFCVELYQTNLSETTTLGPEKFYSYLGMAEYYRTLINTSIGPDKEKNWRNVVSFANKALIERNEEKGALGSELRNERCIKAFLLKSEALTHLGSDTEAIQTCEEALGEDLEYTHELLEFLKTIVNIHTKKGEWTKVIQAVRRQRPRIRSEWLWIRTDDWTDKKDSLRRAAVETRRVDFAIQIFEEAIEYWQTWNVGHSVALQYELSTIYRRDARATKMAEIEIDKLITRLVENRVSLWLVDFIFPKMIDIHYENFTVTQSKDVKRQIIGQVEKMIDRYENMQIIEAMTIGKGLLVLAKMWSNLDGKLKSKQYAERVFALAIADLEDTIGSNDAEAFRLLAKVLMFVDLEIDAKIALSLQFSYVNMSYDDNYSRREDVVVTEQILEPKEPPTPIVQEPAMAQDQTGLGGSETESQQVKETVNGSIDLLHSIGLTKSTDENNSTSTQVVEINDASTTAGETKRSSSADNVLKKDAPDEQAAETLPSPAPSEDEHTVPATLKVESIQTDPTRVTEMNGQEAALVTTKPQQSPADTPVDPSMYQDIMDTDYPIRCSGQCMNPPVIVNSFGPKSEKMYYCLDCDEIQYCKPCYETQIKFYDNYEEGFWYKSCWARHSFISMPIDQWMGVRDGVIRIRKKEKLFKDWLLSVKSRWKRRMNEEEVSNHSSTALV